MYAQSFYVLNGFSTEMPFSVDRRGQGRMSIKFSLALFPHYFSLLSFTSVMFNVQRHRFCDIPHIHTNLNLSRNSHFLYN